MFRLSHILYAVPLLLQLAPGAYAVGEGRTQRITIKAPERTKEAPPLPSLSGGQKLVGLPRQGTEAYAKLLEPLAGLFAAVAVAPERISASQVAEEQALFAAAIDAAFGKETADAPELAFKPRPPQPPIDTELTLKPTPAAPAPDATDEPTPKAITDEPTPKATEEPTPKATEEPTPNATDEPKAIDEPTPNASEAPEAAKPIDEIANVSETEAQKPETTEPTLVAVVAAGEAAVAALATVDTALDASNVAAVAADTGAAVVDTGVAGAVGQDTVDVVPIEP